MAAILDFTRNAITKAPHPYVRHALKPYGTHRVMILLLFYIKTKWYQFLYCFTLHKYRPSWILLTMQCPF